MQIELRREGEAFPQITEQLQITACGLSGFDQKKKKKSRGRETNEPLDLHRFQGVCVFLHLCAPSCQRSKVITFTLVQIHIVTSTDIHQHTANIQR